MDDIKIDNEKNIYKIILKYPEEYNGIKEINLKINTTKKIPNSNYKQILGDYKLINQEKINKMNLNDLNKIYNDYIRNNNKDCCNTKCKIISGRYCFSFFF